MNQFGLHKRVVDVSRRKKNDSERDEDILVGVVEGIGIVSACQAELTKRLALTRIRCTLPRSQRGIRGAF
jgi:hypothetical protein